MGKILLKDLEFEDFELSVLFTTDEEIKALNNQFRNKDKATDVLSFSQLEGEGISSNILGDVVISVETAKKQSEELGHSLSQEILRLFIHGLLHLAGYEHEDVSDEKKLEMEKKEEQLFEKLEEFLTDREER